MTIGTFSYKYFTIPKQPIDLTFFCRKSAFERFLTCKGLDAFDYVYAIGMGVTADYPRRARRLRFLTMSGEIFLHHIAQYLE
jgi:hypothetical protein